MRVHFKAERREETMAHLVETKATKRELDRALRADKLVTLSPRVRKLADEITAGKTGPVEQAHAIYDYLVATMKYDKTTPAGGRATPSARATSGPATAPTSTRSSCRWRAPRASRRASSSASR